MLLKNNKKIKYLFSLSLIYLFTHAIIAQQGCTSVRRFVRRVTPGTNYTVHPGDTIWEIALIHDMPIEAILKANKNSSARNIQAGQKIFIPKYRGNNSKTARNYIYKKNKSKKYNYKKDSDRRKIKLAWPVKNGVQFKKFNNDPDNLYEGLGIAAPAGTLVKASAPGKVIFTGDQGDNYGQVVIIKHKDPFVTIYGHLNKIKVKSGQRIKLGQKIGTVGKTGGVQSPRMLFQVRKNRVAVNPKIYLK